MKNHKDYEHLQQSREAIKVINKRLFPITDLPLLDKFLIDCMLRRRRLSETFPEWSSVNRLPLGIFALMAYVVTLCLSASYNSIIFIGIISLLCIMGYRAKWLMDRLYVLGNNKAIKRAILLSASGLLSIKEFNRDYDEDFLKPALFNYLKGAEIDALKFINMYVELVYALTPTVKETKFLKEQFEDLIKTSDWGQQREKEQREKDVTKKDSVEFINKDLSISKDDKFAEEDQQIEDSLAILVSRSELEESVVEEAEDESDIFTRLLTDKAYFDQKFDKHRTQEKPPAKQVGAFDNEDLDKAMKELIRQEKAAKDEVKAPAFERVEIKEVSERKEPVYKTPPKAVAMSKDESLPSPLIPLLMAAEAAGLAQMDDEEKARQADLLALSDLMADDLLPLDEDAAVTPVLPADPFHEPELAESSGLETELDATMFDDDYDKDLHNQDAFKADDEPKFDFDNVDEIEAKLFSANLKAAMTDEE